MALEKDTFEENVYSVLPLPPYPQGIPFKTPPWWMPEAMDSTRPYINYVFFLYVYGEV